jgi:flagellar biosynthesis/type III secretory pathway chaperone
MSIDLRDNIEEVEHVLETLQRLDREYKEENRNENVAEDRAACSKDCANHDPRCNKNPGFPKQACHLTNPDFADVPQKCPKMCGLCTPCRRIGDLEALLDILED